MNDFKKMLRQDLDDVFINCEEFAEYHEINGKKYLCIVDTDVTQAPQGNRQVINTLGLFGHDAVIYIKEELMKAPKIGAEWNLDRRLGKVTSVSREEGCLVVGFLAYEQ